MGGLTGCAAQGLGKLGLVAGSELLVVGSGSTIGGDMAATTVFFTPVISGIFTLLAASLIGLGLGLKIASGSPTATAAAAAQGTTDIKETEERDLRLVRVRL